MRLRAVGHEVAIAAHAPFEAMVRERGLDFRALPMDIRDELGSVEGQQVLRTSPLAMGRFIRMYARHWVTMAEATEAAAVGADLLLTSAMGFLGVHVAEGKGIPSAGVYLQPMEPTGDFPPWLVSTRSLGRWGNRTAARAARRHGTAILTAALHRFQELGDHRTPPGALAAADHAIALRINRLRSDRRPISRSLRWILSLTALAVTTTPASLFVLPA